MAAWQSLSLRRENNKSLRRKPSSRKSLNLSPRSLQLEPFEERILFALSPELVGILPNPGSVLTENQVLHTAPTELTFRFDNDIDPNSVFINSAVPSIYLRRAGADEAIGTADDPLIVPSYMAMGERPNEVIVRFAQTGARTPMTLPDGTPVPDSPLYDPTLPDDQYQVFFIGAGPNAIKSTSGIAFHNGQNLTRNFTLDLGPRVVSIVPQPVTRDGTGKLTHGTNDIQLNQIVVYFNPDDPPDSASAITKTNYELIRTTDSTDNPVDQVAINPIQIDYIGGKATLTFAAGMLSSAGIYRLRIGNNDPLPLPTVDLGNAFAGSSFDTARQLGAQFPVTQGSQSISVNGTIGGSPVNVIYPGGNGEPGTRNINSQSHLNGTPNTSGVIPIYLYNFQEIIGTLPGGGLAFNSISETQKQRVREVLSYYSNFMGVSFVETLSSGVTIATGDVRAGDPNDPGTGVFVGNGKIVVNSAIDWGSSETGGDYFRIAMSGVGFFLGAGFTDELPSLALQHSSPPLGDSPAAEPVYPGDSDILLGQYLHPPVGNDINMYKLSLPRAGTLNFETIAERLTNLTSGDRQLDSVISVYDSNKKLLARNDNYYGKDSFLQLNLAAGTYYVAVTSTGNTAFDPEIPGTGFGGTTQGRYQLKMTFDPAFSGGIKDVKGTQLDGDNDGAPGGENNFWFRVAPADTASVVHTLYVDKVAVPAQGTGLLGSITNPYTTISDALRFALPGDVVRIEGNGGTDNNFATIADNKSYNIGFDNIGAPLSDGATFEIPQGVTVMIDAGAIIKLRAANVDVGTSVQAVNRSSGALQVLGTVTGVRNNATDPTLRDDAGAVYFTSYYASGIGTDPGTAKDAAARAGNWGGLVFRDDPGLREPQDNDLEAQGIFLNSVNHANISFGGGKVVVDSVEQAYASVHIVTSRPTITFNIITHSADAAVSADPNSFLESTFTGQRPDGPDADLGSDVFDTDYYRVGPKISGNTLSDNSVNGIFIRIRTVDGVSLDPLTISARFSTTDMVYVIKENLVIAGQPGGAISDSNGYHTRPSARLAIDPGAIVKLGGARIETQIGAEFIAEGTAARPIIFTSVFDDRYGAGGSFDTTNDNKEGMVHTVATEGDWGGIFLGPLSIGSIDHVLVTFAGGRTTIEGGFDIFNPLTIYQAKARVANSTFEHNAPGASDGDRNGRTKSTRAVIFVRGAQPVIINNVIQDNDTGAPQSNTAAISINVNSLNSKLVTDGGRSTGPVNIEVASLTNTGPLIRGNRIGDNPVNAMIVRGGTITTNVIWDDTDIVHLVQDEIIAGNQFSVNGTLRLQSTSNESLVVKLEGVKTSLTATGTPLDINDRIGGTVQIVGTPNHPVVLTAALDDTIGAGFTPDGLTQKDTHNRKGVVPPAPVNLTTQGPVILDAAPRDEHGSFFNGNNFDGWNTIQHMVQYIMSASRAPNVPEANQNVLLVIGIIPDSATQLPPSYSQECVDHVCSELGLTPLYLWTGSQIAGVNFNDYKMVYVPSDSQTPMPPVRAQEFDDTPFFGGISDAAIASLAGRRDDLINYINLGGGGLLALSEANAAKPYSFLFPDGDITLKKTGGNIITQTTNTPPEFANFALGDGGLNLGLPWLTSFESATGYRRMQPLAVDPVTGDYAMIGLAPGGPGIGPPQNIVRPGDWRSIKLDALGNDTNVELVNEIEQNFAATGDTNAVPSTAQFLGSLAKDIKNGDDNLRLGFEVHGAISQTKYDTLGGDADVYSFKATTGTTVWFDIDRTASALDTVVELVSATGGVIARSNNSLSEASNPGSLVGTAKPLQMGFSGTSGPFTSPDFYSTNPLDAGMRVTLEGTPGSVNTYFVRVRANSADLQGVNGGLTKGAYQLQIRLQDGDVFPGSVVRSSDIRYANVGVEVIGKPEHSLLQGDTVETTNIHDTFATAQNLGNLLTTDGGGISVAGNLSKAGEVDWYKFDLNYDLVSGFNPLSDFARFFPTMFQINYADGLQRPDTTLSVFDAAGNLIYIGRDSENADSLPRSSMGSDTANTSHGSFGNLDPSIGTVELPAGGTKEDTKFTYYVAVSASNVLPEVLDATFTAAATNPTVRMQPINSVARVFNDSIGGGQQAFPGSTPQQLNSNATAFNLGDVVAYVNSFGSLYTVNPFTGQLQTLPAAFGVRGGLPNAGSNRGYRDIVMRSDGRLMTIPVGNNATVNGTYLQISTADGSLVATGDAGGTGGQYQFVFSDLDDQDPITESSPTNPVATYNFTSAQDDVGLAIHAMSIGNENYSVFDPTMIQTLYVVGNRTVGNGTIPETQNLLFRLDSNSGQPFSYDLESNDVIHSGNAVYQPFPEIPLAQTKGAGSGSAVIPRGTLTTGVFMLGQNATAPVGGFSSFGVPNDLIDGATFFVGDPFNPDLAFIGKRFEFDSGRQLNLDNSATPGVNGVQDLRNGTVFIISGPGAIPNTTLTNNYTLLSGPVLNAIASGNGMTGQTFSITDQNGLTVEFEFGLAGAVGAGRVPVATGATPSDVAANIVTAINSTATAQYPSFATRAALPSVGSTRVTLTHDLQNNAAVVTTSAPGISKEGNWTTAGNIPVVFEETDSMQTFGTDLANTVRISFNDTVTASFARDRVTFAGASSVNFTNFVSPEISVTGTIGTSGTNVPIRFNAADTGADLATAIAAAINGAGVPVDPPLVGISPTFVTATVEGNAVKLSGAKFSQLVNLALKTDSFGFFGSTFSSTIEGIAFLPNLTGGFEDDMYAVSNGGGLYSVTNYQSDDFAELHLLNLFTDDFGPVRFTGLTAGPPHVENGRYARTLFATDERGNIWTFDDQGQPAPILLDGASKVNIFGNQDLANSAQQFQTDIQGITFSTLDYNLWHATTTQGSDEAGANPGNTSFNFGLERPILFSAAYAQPGTANYERDGLIFVSRDPWPGNEALFGSYNLPGGALGSLMTKEFDLTTYSAGDKPTLYFDYSANTEAVDGTGGTMADSFRVYASSDGAQWKQLATNNSVRGSELPPIPSVSGGQYENDRSNQQVQEVFDSTGTPPPQTAIPNSPTTTLGWRQARVDLGDFAGKNHVQIRFDFSTAGSMGIGILKQGGVYLAGVEGTKLAEGQQFVVDNTIGTTTTNHTFTFRSGFILQAPAGGGKAITSGETFIVNGKIYELSKTSAQANGTVLPNFHVLVKVNDSMSAETVASSILDSMTINPTAGVTPIRVADRVQLQSAAIVTQGVGPQPGLILQGAAMPAVLADTDVTFTIDMTDDRVAIQVARALDAHFSAVNGNTDVLTYQDASGVTHDFFTTSKVDGRTIRLFGHNVISAGPLPYSNALFGDENGKFYSQLVTDGGVNLFRDVDAAARRGQNNAHEGVFIDNFVLGFAGRGEQVFNSLVPAPPQVPGEPPSVPFSDSTLNEIPFDTTGGQRVRTGGYQLSIRRGTEYIAQTDINDRFAQGITIYSLPASQIADGQTFSIFSTGGAVTFEFKKDNGTLSAVGNQRVLIGTGYDSTAVAIAIRNAINNVPSSFNFNVKAGLNSQASGQTSAAINLFGAVDVNPGPMAMRVFGRDINFSGQSLPVLGDNLPSRVQGQTIVNGNQVTHSLRVGVQVMPKTGQIVDTLLDFTETSFFPMGVGGAAQSATNLPTANTAQLVTGVTIKNNLVADSGRTGIQFGGNPNAGGSYAQRGETVFFVYENGVFQLEDFDRNGNGLIDFLTTPDNGGISQAVPFGRIVNNTVVNAKNGIAAVNKSSPTIMNNIVTNSGQALTNLIGFVGAGITTDPASSTTVIGTNVYQSNINPNVSTIFNQGGPVDSSSIALQPTDPLFTSLADRNFYLKQNSLAIDSSVNTLQERPNLQSVNAPLGIAPSSIQAPDIDLLGQLRVDDPNVPSPPGLGSNVFKDRGALERSDSSGPIATLRNPLDNDAGGLDRTAATSGADLNKVLIVGRQLPDFTIQLNDLGLGIDDSTVSVTKFVITRKIGNGPVTTLEPGREYSLWFDTTNKIARLIPAKGIWEFGTYTVTLANGASPAAIKDRNGNSLQPNNVSGATQFEIKLSETAVSPWQNQVNQLDVNASGTISGLDALLIINRLLLGQAGPLPAVATVPPYLDTDGNGSLSAFDALLVISYLTSHPASAQVQSLVTTTQDVSASPSAMVASPSAAAASPSATAATQASPAVSPTVNSAAAGIAVSQMTSLDDDSADAIAQSSIDFMATPTVSSAKAQNPSALLTAKFASEAFDDSDSELDDILSDLAEDTLQVSA